MSLRKSFTGRRGSGKRSVLPLPLSLTLSQDLLCQTLSSSIYRQSPRANHSLCPLGPPFTPCPVPCFTASCSNLCSLAFPPSPSLSLSLSLSDTHTHTHTHTHTLVSLWLPNVCYLLMPFLSLSDLQPSIWKWNAVHSETSTSTLLLLLFSLHFH